MTLRLVIFLKSTWSTHLNWTIFTQTIRLPQNEMVITRHMLFPYQQELKKELGYKPAKVGA